MNFSKLLEILNLKNSVKRLRESLCVVAFSLLSYGCADSEMDAFSKRVFLAKQVYTSILKDPESVKFRNERFMTLGNKQGEVFDFLCAEVNAKNSYGGYVGYRQVLIYVPTGDARVDSMGIMRLGEEEDKFLFGSGSVDKCPLGKEMAEYVSLRREVFKAFRN